MTILAKAVLISGLALTGAVVQAAPLVKYDMSSRPDHPNRHDPVIQDRAVSANRLEAVGTTLAYSSAFSVDSIAIKPNVPSIDLTGALENGTYLSFTLAAGGGKLSLDSLDFGAYPGGGTPRTFAVYSSVSGFTEGCELLKVGFHQLATNVTPYHIDLNSIDGYREAARVEFRIYVQADEINRSINVSGLTVNGSVVAGDPVTITPSSDWIELSGFTTDIMPGSVFDFSFLNDAPAGKYGPVKVTPEGHFEFENRPGERVRFRGVNLVTSGCYLDPESADRVADRLVRSGYNSVRLHHFDRALQLSGAAAGQLDPAKLDQLDYLFSALKNRGLYINIDLFSLRVFSSEDMVSFGLPADAAAGLTGGKAAAIFKWILPFSDAAFTNWCSFSSALLQHRNPYTGLTWAEDPALVGICPVNEDVVGSSIDKDLPLAPIYNKAFSAWLEQGDHQAIYERDGYDGTFARFLSEVHDRVNQRFMAYLRETGIRTPLTGSNHRETQGMTYLREDYDYVDNHQYWDHPRFPGKRFKLPFKFKQLSAVATTASTPRNIMAARVFKKPYTVTEFNYVRPNQFRAEGGVIISAYAALQDWDGLYNFDYANGFVNDAGKISDNFSISIDPIGLLGDRVSSLIFLGENVAPASDAVVFAVEDRTAYTERNTYFGDAIAHIGLVTRIASMTLPPKEILQLPGVSAVVVDKDSASVDPANHIYAADENLATQLQSAGILPAGSIDSAGQCFKSSTGQIKLDAPDGTLQVVSPRSELFVLPPATALEGALVSVTNQDVFCSIFVASVDQAPLASSQRILVLHLTDAAFTGTQFSSEDLTLLEDRGDWPMLIKNAAADITLNLPADASFEAWAVGIDGARLHPVPLEKTEHGWIIHARTDRGGVPQLAYEIVRK